MNLQNRNWFRDLENILMVAKGGEEGRMGAKREKEENQVRLLSLFFFFV